MINNSNKRPNTTRNYKLDSLCALLNQGSFLLRQNQIILDRLKWQWLTRIWLNQIRENDIIYANCVLFKTIPGNWSWIHTKKAILRIVFGEKMYEIERVTLIEIIIFTLIAVTALQKRQLKTLTHNADATHEFRIEKQHKLMISL